MGFCDCENRWIVCSSSLLTAALIVHQSSAPIVAAQHQHQSAPLNLWQLQPFPLLTSLSPLLTLLLEFINIGTDTFRRLLQLQILWLNSVWKASYKEKIVAVSRKYWCQNWQHYCHPQPIIHPWSVAAKPDVTLTIKDADLVDLMSGKLNSQKAFFQGKLKVTRSDETI